MEASDLKDTTWIILNDWSNALWYYIEAPTYYIITFLLSIVDHILNYVASNVLLAIITIITMPFIILLLKDIIITAYKMVLG